MMLFCLYLHTSMFLIKKIILSVLEATCPKPAIILFLYRDMVWVYITIHVIVHTINLGPHSAPALQGPNFSNLVFGKGSSFLLFFQLIF